MNGRLVLRSGGIVVALAFLMGSLACIGAYALGDWMRKHPQRGERVFFWMPRYAAACFRSAGFFFMALAVVGALYSVLMAIVRIA